jgi:hypothetical protein
MNVAIDRYILYFMPAQLTGAVVGDAVNYAASTLMPSRGACTWACARALAGVMRMCAAQV